jgi:hypothetical protein
MDVPLPPVVLRKHGHRANEIRHIDSRPRIRVRQIEIDPEQRLSCWRNLDSFDVKDILGRRGGHQSGE